MGVDADNTMRRCLQLLLQGLGKGFVESARKVMPGGLGNAYCTQKEIAQNITVYTVALWERSDTDVASDSAANSGRTTAPNDVPGTGAPNGSALVRGLFEGV